MRLRCLALLTALTAPCAPAAADSALRLTYVANAGFLLEGTGRKVLIDTPMDQGLRYYAKVPQGLRPAIEQAKAPFDGVDLLLFTHFHDDHFGPRAVARHLRANARAHVVAPPQVVDRLRPHLDGDAALLDRVEAVYPDEGESVELRRNGIELRVLNLHHGRDRDPPVQNLGFIVELGKLRVLHIGDSEATAADLAPYELPAASIDVGLLPVWFLTYDEWVEAVRQQIRPAQIVAMHLATPDAPADYFGPEGSQVERLRVVRENFPGAIVPLEPGSTLELPRGPEP